MIGKIKTVLIVEDDLIISLVIERMVKEIGLNVIAKATTGLDAINKAYQFNPDLILMDIRLKGEMDGIEAVKKIKEKIKTAIIYITGNSDSNYLERAEQTDFVEMIPKPFSLSDIKRSVELV